MSVGERKGLSAGSERKTCKDCATSTAWTLLWYGLSRYDKSRALYGEGGKERRVDGEGGGVKRRGRVRGVKTVEIVANEHPLATYNRRHRAHYMQANQRIEDGHNPLSVPLHP